MGQVAPKGATCPGRGASCPTHGASCPFGNTSFKLELYKNVYTHSSWNWHMCSTNRALSWHKNIECLSKVCDQEVHQTLKGGVLPHPTLWYKHNALYEQTKTDYNKTVRIFYVLYSIMPDFAIFLTLKVPRDFREISMVILNDVICSKEVIRNDKTPEKLNV